MERQTLSRLKTEHLRDILHDAHWLLRFIVGAEEFYQKGLDFGKEGDAEGAIECWGKTVELNPKHFEGWYNLGNAYDIGKGDLESALECWKKALELKSDNIDEDLVGKQVKAIFKPTNQREGNLKDILYFTKK